MLPVSRLVSKLLWDAWIRALHTPCALSSHSYSERDICYVVNNVIPEQDIRYVVNRVIDKLEITYALRSSKCVSFQNSY